MLELRTGSGNLVLDPKTSIRFSYIHPMFVTDGIPSTVSYHFDLPDDLKGINQKILGASRYLDVAKKTKMVNVSILFNGLEIDAGIIIAKAAADGKFRSIFYGSIFEEDFADLEMQKIAYLLMPIELGADATAIAAAAKAKNTAIDTDVVFPTIYAPEFYGSANPDFNGFFNLPDENGNFPINTIVKEWEEGDPEEGIYETNRFSLLAAFYAKAILRDIFKSQGYNVKGGFLVSEVMRNAVILSLKAADRAVAETYVDALVTGYYDEPQGTWRLLSSNDYKKGTETEFDLSEFRILHKGYYEVSVTELKLRHVQGDTVAYLAIQGGFETQAFIQKNDPTEDTIFEASAFFWYGDDIASNILVMINRNYEPISGKISIVGVSRNRLNRFATSVNIGESFKGITTSKMVNALRKLFGLLIFPDKMRNTIQIELCSDFINNRKALDITNWVIGELEFEYNESKNYKISYDWDDADTMKTLYPAKATEYDHPFTIPNPVANSFIKIKNLFRYLKSERPDLVYIWSDSQTFVEDIQSGIKKGEDYKPELQSLVSHADFEKKIIAPHLKGEGRSDAYGNDSELKLTVLNYLGINNSGGLTFPMASMGNLNSNGAAISSIKSLRLDGDDGHYKTTLKPLLDIVGNHDTITAYLFLTPERLQKLLRMFQSSIDGETEPERIIRIDGNELYIKSFDFQISTKGIEAAEIKLAKEKYE